MPELPEVEVFKKYADATSLHKTIDSVETNGEEVFETSPQKIASELKGKQLEASKRIGKHLFIRYADAAWLNLHFGMTGSLKYYKDDGPPDYARLVLHFENGYQLAYLCPRKLGKIGLTDDPDAFAQENDLGPDALRLGEEEFLEKMNSKRGGIKSALMDQGFMTGIGNIYSDEILFQAGIHPEAKVEALNEEQCKTLFHKMKEVLKESIDCKAEPGQLPGHFLIPHRKEGADCPDGSGKVKKIKVNGRSCYYCPEKQKMPST